MGNNLVCGVISFHFIWWLLFIARQQTKPSDINKLTLCSNQKRFHLHITDSKMSAPPKRLPRLPFSGKENPCVQGKRIQYNVIKRLGENVKGQRQSNFSVMLSSYCRTTGACRSFQFIATHNCDVIWGPGLTQDRDILNKHWHKTENSPDFKLKRKLQQRKKRREERVHRHKKWFRRHQ